jgi:hypothetical protein
MPFGTPPAEYSASFGKSVFGPNSSSSSGSEVLLPGVVIGAGGGGGGGKGGGGGVDAGLLDALVARIQVSQRKIAEEVYAKVEAANKDMLAKIEAENKVRRQKDKDEMKKNLEGELKKSFEALASKLAAMVDDKVTKGREGVSAAISKEVRHAHQIYNYILLLK